MAHKWKVNLQIIEMGPIIICVKPTSPACDLYKGIHLMFTESEGKGKVISVL